MSVWEAERHLADNRRYARRHAENHEPNDDPTS
jgi:hypothetical protein